MLCALVSPGSDLSVVMVPYGHPLDWRHPANFCNATALPDSWKLIGPTYISDSPPGLLGAGWRWLVCTGGRVAGTTVHNYGESDAASSSSSIGRYAQGASQCGLQRPRDRRRRRRLDGASQARLVALCAAARFRAACVDRPCDGLAARGLIFSSRGAQWLLGLFARRGQRWLFD